MIDLTHKLLNKFHINIKHLINNTDNTMEDIINEAFIVVNDFYYNILSNKNVFINELRKRCYKFNKYGKKIDNNKDWERFNNYEQLMFKESKTSTILNEDLLLSIIDIKRIISEEEYNFLIDYYSYGQNVVSERYNLKVGTLRKRVHTLINKIKKELKNE